MYACSAHMRVRVDVKEDVLARDSHRHVKDRGVHAVLERARGAVYV